MKTGIKLLIAAVLSLSVGVAFAAPLYVTDMNIKPFPRMPQGPTADSTISVVYANFSISPGNTLYGDTATSFLNYEVVLNVTNLSDLGAKFTRLGFTAAQLIEATPTTVGLMEYIASSNPANQGFSVSGGSLQSPISEDIMPGTNWGIWSETKNGITLAGGQGLITGVWLDGKWINVTWILGKDYPGWPAPIGGWHPSADGNAKLPSLSETWPTTKTIPELPARAAVEGTWVEGVPLIEMHNITIAADKTTKISSVTAIFINGTWVDVTGRVRAAHEGLYIRATNVIVGEKRYFGAEPPAIPVNATNNSTQSWHENAAWRPVLTYTPTGEGEFNDYWAPHQSRLILLKGTREVLPNMGVDTLSTGKITLLAEEFNQVQDPTVNSTALYTFSGGHWLNQVPLQKTANSYIYNTIIDENQMFQPDQYGVEVFIKSRS
jgi:hypothetical protein